MGQEGFIRFFILRFSQLLVSKPCILVNCLKQGSHIAITKKIILEWSFLILNTILYFSMLMNIWQFHLSSWQRMGFMWAIPVFVYTGLLWQGIPTVTQAKSYLLLKFFPCYLHFAFCLYVWPKSPLCLTISPLELFQGICNIEGLKGETLEHWITGGT